MTKEDVVVEAEKVVREYKGDIINVSDLMGEVCVARETTVVEIPAVGGKWGRAAGQKLPRLFIVTGVQASQFGKNALYLTYVAYGKCWRTGGVDVSADFKVKNRTGRQ